MNTLKGIRGITLVELMTTVSVAALTLTIGVPSFMGVKERMQRSQVTIELTSSFTLARSEAARRGTPVSVCASADAKTCIEGDSPSWSSGWIVFSDANNKLTVDSGEEVLYAAQFENPRFTLTPESAVARGVSFKSSGFPDQRGSFTYCDSSESRQLTLGYVGRMDLTSSGTGCS